MMRLRHGPHRTAARRTGHKKRSGSRYREPDRCLPDNAEGYSFDARGAASE